MSTESDLKALEPWAGVIDPTKALLCERTAFGYRYSAKNGTCVEDDGSTSTIVFPVSAVVALASRLEQAREWIRARCNDTGDSFEESYYPGPPRPHCFVDINGLWMGQGDSPAEALAHAIKNIVDLGKKGGAR